VGISAPRGVGLATPEMETTCPTVGKNVFRSAPSGGDGTPAAGAGTPEGGVDEAGGRTLGCPTAPGGSTEAAGLTAPDC